MVARIVLAWRRLTSPEGTRRAGKGAPTLVACSGGADSIALALALHVAKAPIVIGHVVHDLRSASEAIADRDAVRDLARRLGVEFAEAGVSVPRGVGRNAESEARRLRYAALADMAHSRGIRYVATGHQADDQLESVLMALLRGAGPRGLGGMRESRVLRRADSRGGGVILIRPMLHQDACVTRAEAEGLCARAGQRPQVDATNADLSKLRAALRARVVPVLAEIRPNLRERAATAATLMQGADRVIRLRARRLLSEAGTTGGCLLWARTGLRCADPVILGELLRAAHRKVAGARGLDAIGARSLARVLRAVRDQSTDPRSFTLGRVQVRVDARRVRVSKRQPRPAARD